MFRQLARLVFPGTAPPTPQQVAATVLDLHPIQLSRYLEEVWAARNTNLLTPPGMEIPAAIPELALERSSGIRAGIPIPAVNRESYPPSIWDHLMYAYMIENTRVYEIFRRVLEEYAYGERLGVASADALRWLRTTEQLFYRDNPPFQIYALASWIRPDIRAIRRNAYHRMFGLDLNHGTDDNRPYPYPRTAAANTGFIPAFEELLREVWRAIENIRNQVGANPTDESTIANLARTLFDMLRVRRQDGIGNLARDELFHVATMSWFHLTLEFDTAIVVSLKAEAPSAAERLQKIGERIGLPAHSRSDSYFFLADNLSLILRELEIGTFNTEPGARALFTPGTTTTPNPFHAAMQQIVTHWSIATGREVKQRPVSVAAAKPAPIRPTPPGGAGRATPAPPPVPVGSNGQGPVSAETLV